jgi:hypothetical protein
MKRVLIAGTLAIVALCGYFAVQYYQRASDPLVAGVPPRENADGTIDYTLAFRPRSDLLGYYWVLRFQKSQFVRESKPRNTFKLESLDGQSSYKSDSRKNQWLELFFKLPNVSPWLGNVDLKAKDEPPILKVKALDLRTDTQFLSADFSKSAKERCLEVQRLGTRVIVYVEKNLPQNMNCFASNVGFIKVTGYSVLNDEGHHIADYSCTKSGDGVIGNCSGTILLSFDRTLLVTFYSSQLSVEQFPVVTDRLIDIFVKATVVVETVFPNTEFKLVHERPVK